MTTREIFEHYITFYVEPFEHLDFANEIQQNWTEEDRSVLNKMVQNDWSREDNL